MRVTAAVVRTAAAGLAAAATAACATAGRAPGLSSELPSELPPQLARRLTPEFRRERLAPARSSLTQIGTDVLSVDPGRTVYEIVERRWPTMLRPPSAALGVDRDPRGDVIGVYAKAGWLGGQETLRGVRAAHVLTLYRLSPSQEYLRYGRSHAGGAVEIIWR